MESKEAIRAVCLARRRALTREEVAEASAAICARVAGMEAIREARAILTYVASKDNEVDTLPLIARFLGEGRVVLVPVMQRAGALAWARIEAIEELAPARFGILEPRAECVRSVEVPEEAPILVPGVAFTRLGDRIGYGGGYFDRMLARHGGCTIGLAYECQIVEAMPSAPHDIRLRFVITERAVYGGEIEAGA